MKTLTPKYNLWEANGSSGRTVSNRTPSPHKKVQLKMDYVWRMRGKSLSNKTLFVVHFPQPRSDVGMRFRKHVTPRRGCRQTTDSRGQQCRLRTRRPQCSQGLKWTQSWDYPSSAPHCIVEILHRPPVTPTSKEALILCLYMVQMISVDENWHKNVTWCLVLKIQLHIKTIFMMSRQTIL